MHDELRLRTRMIAAGLWLSTVLLVAVAGWIAATWGRPHRGGLVAMAGAAAVATAVIAAVPRHRIVASRYREPFFLSWSLSLIVFIAVAAGLDDGVRSPIVLMLFLTLVYAALSYPRWAVAVISGVSLLAVLCLSLLGGSHGGVPANPVYLVGLMLTLAVTGVMCIYQARIQQEARTELGRLSRTDPLTGSLNRLGFSERLSAELDRVRLDGHVVALVVLDFDDFKVVNDRHGHSAGDELLCWATGAMTAALRPGDVLGRLGGDEFAALA
jgi:predicted signal transduction protein with EAL and GGDEF domain